MTVETRRPSLVWQVGTTSVAQVASVLVSLLTLAVLARMLGPEVFGTFAVTVAILALGTVLADAGFAAVLVQRPAIDGSAVGAATSLSLALGLLSVGVALGLSLPLERAFQIDGLASILIAASWGLPLLAVASVGSALLQRRGQFGRLSAISLLAQMASGVASIAAAWSGYGVWALVVGYWAAAIVSASGGAIVIAGARPTITRRAMSLALRSGHVFTLAKIIGWAASNADQMVLARLLGAADLGIYSRVHALVSKVNLIFGAAAHRVFFSAFARVQDDLERLAAAFEDALSAYLIVAGLLSAFTFIFAHEIVLLLLGPDWSAAAEVLQIAALGMIARSGHVVAEAVPAALGLYRINAARHALRLALTIAGAVIGARWGLEGAMAGSVLAFWLFYLSSLAAVVRLTPVNGHRVVSQHLHAIILTAPAAAASEFALSMLSETAISTIGAIATFIGVAALTLLLWPRRQLSAPMIRLRDKLLLPRAAWAERGEDRV